MNNKQLITYIFSYLLLLACSSQKLISEEIIGRKFSSRSESRKMEIKIIDAENLEVTNEFYCTNIDEQFRKTAFKKKYRRNGNSIILNDSIFNFKLPYFDNSSCAFLSEKYRNTEDRKIFDGRTLDSNQERLYSIWNIDTLKIIGNNLVYMKKVKRGSKGYLFK